MISHVSEMKKKRRIFSILWYSADSDLAGNSSTDHIAGCSLLFPVAFLGQSKKLQATYSMKNRH